MKKKIIMYGIGNQNKFSYYIFEKSQKSFETLAKLFCKLLGSSWDIYTEEHHGRNTSKKIFVKNLIDKHDTTYTASGKNRLDLFYGKNKMFISIHCPEKKRIEINEALRKITKMPKPKKI